MIFSLIYPNFSGFDYQRSNTVINGQTGGSPGEIAADSDIDGVGHLGPIGDGNHEAGPFC